MSCDANSDASSEKRDVASSSDDVVESSDSVSEMGGGSYDIAVVLPAHGLAVITIWCTRAVVASPAICPSRPVTPSVAADRCRSTTDANAAAARCLTQQNRRGDERLTHSIEEDPF